MAKLSVRLTELVAEWFNEIIAQLVEVVQSWMKKIMFDWKIPKLYKCWKMAQRMRT